jgi:hypothetical protein
LQNTRYSIDKLNQLCIRSYIITLVAYIVENTKGENCSSPFVLYIIPSLCILLLDAYFSICYHIFNKGRVVETACLKNSLRVVPSTICEFRDGATFFILSNNQKLLILLMCQGDNRYKQQTECKDTTQCFKSNHIITSSRGKPSLYRHALCKTAWLLSNTYFTTFHPIRLYKIGSYYYFL